MPPKRTMVRAPTPQVEEEVSAIGSIRGEAAVVRQPNQVAPREDGSSILEKFLKLHPPIFKGESDPRGTKGWIKKLSKIFEAMQISDERKMMLVPYILEDEVDFCWDMVTRTEDVDNMFWEAFKKLFLAKYYPEVKHEA